MAVRLSRGPRPGLQPALCYFPKGTSCKGCLVCVLRNQIRSALFLDRSSIQRNRFVSYKRSRTRLTQRRSMSDINLSCMLEVFVEPNMSILAWIALVNDQQRCNVAKIAIRRNKLSHNQHSCLYIRCVNRKTPVPDAHSIRQHVYAQTCSGIRDIETAQTVWQLYAFHWKR